MAKPLRNLTADNRRGEEVSQAYTMEDVDKVSERLGIPWERSKDVPFRLKIPFISFNWDLEVKTVSLQKKKKEKHASAIVEWKRRKSHTLGDVEQLYGKLLHMCSIVPEGQAYLTGLESMLSIFPQSPHKPRHPPRQVEHNLLWWLRVLSKLILV